MQEQGELVTGGKGLRGYNGLWDMGGARHWGGVGGQGKERPVYCRRTERVNGLGEREGRLVGG